VRYLFQFLKWLADCERIETWDILCADWERDSLESYGIKLPTQDHCVVLIGGEELEEVTDKKRYILEAFLVTDKDVIDLTFVTPLFTDLTSFLESLGLLRRKIYGYIVYRKPGDVR